MSANVRPQGLTPPTGNELLLEECLKKWRKAVFNSIISKFTNSSATSYTCLMIYFISFTNWVEILSPASQIETPPRTCLGSDHSYLLFVYFKCPILMCWLSNFMMKCITCNEINNIKNYGKSRPLVGNSTQNGLYTKTLHSILRLSICVYSSFLNSEFKLGANNRETRLPNRNSSHNPL